MGTYAQASASTVGKGERRASWGIVGSGRQAACLLPQATRPPPLGVRFATVRAESYSQSFIFVQ